jgi:hypothetical protein
MTRYLLSIDSGGIRGIIPAIALVKVEGWVQHDTRQQIAMAAQSTSLVS